MAYSQGEAKDGRGGAKQGFGNRPGNSQSDESTNPTECDLGVDTDTVQFFEDEESCETDNALLILA